ncbi:MAG TPA: AMIN domain-containing protein, partial [Gammaproteobacteria bacterium]
MTSIRQVLVSLLLLAGICGTSAAATLDAISHSALPGDRVQLKLQFSEPLAEEPVNFTIDNPARIAVDLPGVGLNLAEKSQTIGVGVAHSVAAVEAAGRTRVVVNLARVVSYEMEMDGNALIITLGGSAAAAPAPVVAGAASAASGAGGASVQGIDFRRGDDGEGRIIVTLSNPSVGVNMSQEGGQIVIDFLSAGLPSDLDRKLDVVDFATPVKEIDTKPFAGGTRMLVSTT